MKNALRFALPLVLSMLSCTRLDLVEPAAVTRGLSAPCVANVEGTGEIDVELDYLPHVIACENGAADYEALRAQAVAARSYLAYKIDRSPGTPIQDGTGDQVYTCANAPGAIHYEAVATTSGEILRYADTVVAAFYVAGAIPTAASCIASDDDNDYSNTERYVTINDGRSALGITQTTLGFVAPTNWANRGCHSQNGANCLSERGFGYDDILRFYYGTDIEVVVGEGECVAPDDGPYVCGAVSSSGTTAVDPSHACFVSGCASSTLGPEGDAVGALFGAARAERDCFGRWRLSFDDAGSFDLAMTVPDVVGLANNATVIVRHAGEESVVVVDQDATRGTTVSLGTFAFAKGRHQWVEIDDATGADGDPSTGPFVAFPQILIAPAGSLVDDAGQFDVDGGVSMPADGGYDDDAGPPLPPSVVACACTSLTRDTPPVLLAVLVVVIFAVQRRPRTRARKASTH